jgi:prophage antirepressor-like protein
MKNLLNIFKRDNRQEVKTFNKTIKLMQCVDCGKFFCDAKDVCNLLEIEDTELALNELDPDMKEEMFPEEDCDLWEADKNDVLTMSGVFALVFQSKTPFAKDTQRWIIDEFVKKVLLSEGVSKELGLLPAEAVC